MECLTYRAKKKKQNRFLLGKAVALYYEKGNAYVF